ncbi:cysteine--tRNA ligase [Rhizobium sp. EC-SD404]|uniref:cysteine--tRNA ligase n=1 Tax=Rhizobium sp. EC-SD404 TaxID=2038389 RepID=UPI00125B8231|nr:cysteine--tRNA ligase [Rhizobium sp. EC-SD404]VVT15734.1 Cysteine--tRNA ligase [Rhizobium sp. EC-SD404]
MGERPELKLYNTLTRTKEAFAPIDPDNVRMYVCGPTVYDYAHIGNARPVIVFDVLFRLLRHVYGEDHVTYVRNITDVDDKINARALRDYPNLPLNEAIRAVTEKTEAQFQADAKALGCLAPTVQPRATDFVLPRPDGKTDMVSLIQSLISRGHAYDAAGEILFDVSSMGDYGKLSNRRLEDQQAGARVAVERHKKNPGDFVLWKESSADEPGWDAHFHMSDSRSLAIRGRPGWHIECSAMSAAYLGQTFDIHGGGLDLIFPHHENEIAQSRCAHGTDVMANIWMHNGFLQVEGRKMSKSEGNFVTINELLETEKFGGRKWPGEVLRLAMLMTHYREPIDFSVRRLEEAEALLRGWAEDVDEAQADLDAQPDELFMSYLRDDLNLYPAVNRVSELVSGSGRGTPAGLIALAILGLSPIRYHEQMEALTFSAEFGAADVEAIISQRLVFIANKNWSEADRIRDELLAQGVQLKDGKDPATGERVTTWEVKR